MSILTLPYTIQSLGTANLVTVNNQPTIPASIFDANFSALASQFYYGTTAPANPTIGMIWINGSTVQIYTQNGWAFDISATNVINYQSVYSSSATLTTNDLGHVVFFIGSTASTFTLPLANIVPEWKGILIISNVSSATLTIACQSGNTTDLINTTLLPYQQVMLINDGDSTWRALTYNNSNAYPVTTAQFVSATATCSATTCSGTSGTLTAPTNGYALAVAQVANTNDANITAFSISASLSGFQQSIVYYAGGAYAFGILPMTRGQSTTFTITITYGAGGGFASMSAWFVSTQLI